MCFSVFLVYDDFFIDTRTAQNTKTTEGSETVLLYLASAGFLISMAIRGVVLLPYAAGLKSVLSFPQYCSHTTYDHTDDVSFPLTVPDDDLLPVAFTYEVFIHRWTLLELTIFHLFSLETEKCVVN